MNKLERLIEAENKARLLFELIESNHLIRPGITEKELSDSIFALAKKEFNTDKFWHKKIVRSGKNSIFPYDENPDDLIILPDDILWIDFGPVFNEMEADFGRTYVLGNDEEKLRIKKSVEDAWIKTRDFYVQREQISGRDLFIYAQDLAQQDGFKFGNNIAGHLIDEFSHYKNHRSVPENYICMENLTDLKKPYDGKERFWILEIHFVNEKNESGSFFEQLLI